MNVLRITPQGAEPAGDRLAPIVEGLNGQRAWLANVPLSALLALWDDFSARLLRDPRTRPLEGVMFLSAWLRRANLQKTAATEHLRQPRLSRRFPARGQSPPGGQAAGAGGHVDGRQRGHAADVLAGARIAGQERLPGEAGRGRSRRHGPAAGRAGRVAGRRAAGRRAAAGRGRRLVRLPATAAQRRNVAGRRRPRRLGRPRGRPRHLARCRAASIASRSSSAPSIPSA